MAEGKRNKKSNWSKQLQIEKYKKSKKLERALRRDHFDGMVAPKGNKSRSEKSRAKWRNDPRRDAVILRYIGDKLRGEQPVRLSTNSSHTVWLAKRTLAQAKREQRRIIPNVFIPHWDHTSPLMKLLGWGLASEALGATPFTLRVHPGVMGLALNSPKGPASWLQDRIKRHLRVCLPTHSIDFWFVVEQGQGEEPHIHGSITIPPDCGEAIVKALQSAGGPWEPRGKQLRISDKGDPIQWVGYVTKWLMISSENLGSLRPFSATQGMKREAKNRYQKSRSSMKAIYPL